MLCEDQWKTTLADVFGGVKGSGGQSQLNFSSTIRITGTIVIPRRVTRREKLQTLAER